MSKQATQPANAAEWIERWNELTTDRKHEVADRLMWAQETASACFMGDHEHRIEMLTGQLREADGWWTERFAEGMKAMEPDIKWRDERIAELEAEVANLNAWRDAVLASPSVPPKDGER